MTSNTRRTQRPENKTQVISLCLPQLPFIQTQWQSVTPSILKMCNILEP